MNSESTWFVSADIDADIPRGVIHVSILATFAMLVIQRIHLYKPYLGLKRVSFEYELGTMFKYLAEDSQWGIDC